MKYLLTSIIICSLFSCKTSLFQVQTTSSKNLKSDSINNTYTYEDSLVIVKYNLWREGGAVSFSIFNKTDAAFYIHWNKSNLVYEGYRYDYMKNKPVANDSAIINKYREFSTSVTYYTHQMPPIEIPRYDSINVRLFHLNRKSTSSLTSPYHKKGDNEEVFTEEYTPLSFENNIAISKDIDYSNVNLINNTIWVSRTQNYNKRGFHKSEKPLANSFYVKKHVINGPGTLAVTLGASIATIGLVSLIISLFNDNGDSGPWWY